MHESLFFNIYTQIGGVAITVIAAALAIRHFLKRRKSKLNSYLNADYSISFIPRDSEN